MWKWTKRIVLVVLLLLIVGGVILFYNLNGIIRGQVEQQSTKSLNLATSLDSASLSLFGGNLSLRDYKVASPPGFSSEPFLTLGGLDVGVSYGELRQSPVRIQSITIDRPKMVLEQKGGKFNVKAMVDNLPGAKPSEPTPPGQPAPQPPQPSEPKPGEPKPGEPQQVPPSEGETLKLIISQISVKDPEVILRPGIPGLADQIPIKIQSFEMKDVGNSDNSQNGVAVKQIVTELVTTLAAKASNSKDLPEQLRMLLNGDLNSIAQHYIPGRAGELVGSLLNESTLKNPQQAVGNLLNEATGGATTNPAEAAKSAFKDVTEGKDPTKQLKDNFKGLLGDKDDKKDKKNKKKSGE